MRLVAVLLALFALLAASACAEVRPWQRGALAHHAMDPRAKAPLVANEFLNHVFDVREGATGAMGQAGGGCGCN